MAFSLEGLVEREHAVRLIWALVGKLDLSALEEDVASLENKSGRAAWSPQLLTSVLIYGYMKGISSAREMEREMERDPGFRWLTGDQPINHHTLSDFRRQDGKKLEGIFSQVLASLASEGLVDFETLLQDGTKVRAQAGAGSMRRRQTLTEHLAEAQKCVEELDRRREQAGPADKERGRTKKEAAVERAMRERLARLEEALQELQEREETTPASRREELRVSETEPEARKMKHADGGFHPSYNVQIVTEAKTGFTVGWTVSTAYNDQHELQAGVAMATRCTGQGVKTVVADGGYGYRHNIELLTKEGIELVAPRPDEEKREAGALKRAGIDAEFGPSKFKLAEEGAALECPAGERLVEIGTARHHGQWVRRYQAEAAVCGACRYKPQCCRKREARMVERVMESEAVQEHDRRMADPVRQQLYGKRKQFAEYAFLRLKWNWKMDRFRLRGLANVIKEVGWQCLAFCFDRLHWVRQSAVRAAQAAAV